MQILSPFFAIITAISLFTFSQYSEQFIQMSADYNIQQTEKIENILPDSVKEAKDLEVFGYENESEFKQALMKFQLKYYIIFAFLSLPVYTLISFLVFRKPYNFAEHLLINTYLQGIITFLTILFFALSMLFGFNILTSGIIILPIFYYSFAYKSLYKLTFGQLLLKILKFIGIMLLFMIIPVLIGFLSAAIRN